MPVQMARRSSKSPTRKRSGRLTSQMPHHPQHPCSQVPLHSTSTRASIGSVELFARMNPTSEGVSRWFGWSTLQQVTSFGQEYGDVHPICTAFDILSMFSAGQSAVVANQELPVAADSPMANGTAKKHKKHKEKKGQLYLAICILIGSCMSLYSGAAVLSIPDSDVLHAGDKQR